MKTVFTFLKNLAGNNNRDWFNNHKETYLVAQAETVDFVEKIIDQISQFEEGFEKTDAKKSLFRIYRDTRFSADKSPYKTNFGASLGMSRNSQKAGYYLHIEPGKSFLAGGLYMPDSTTLKAVRKAISEESAEFLEIVGNPDFKKTFGTLNTGNTLVKVPQGFDKAHPMADYLKLKSFFVMHPLRDSDFYKTDAAKNFAEIFRRMKPLNDFLNQSMDPINDVRKAQS